MPIITGTLGTQRPELSDAIYQYSPDGIKFAADEIFPPLMVNEQAGQFEVVSRETMLKLNEAGRAKGGAYNRINEYMEVKDYVCKDWGLEITDNYTYRQTVQYNRELGKIRAIKMGIQLAREKRVAETILNSTTWTGSALYTDVSTAWATVASADPRSDVLAAKKKVRDATGVSPNALILSELNLDYLINNAKIRAEIQYTAVPTEAQVVTALPALFGLEKLIVIGARYDSGAEGVSTSTTTSCGGDSYVSVARVGNANDPVSPAVGFTPVFDEDSGLPFIVESYWEEQTRSMVYRVRHNICEVVIDPYFAHLLKVD